MPSQFCRKPCPAGIKEGDPEGKCAGVCRVMNKQHAGVIHQCHRGHQWQYGVCKVCKGKGQAPGSTLPCGTCGGKGWH
jgi:hypothetical protein